MTCAAYKSRALRKGKLEPIGVIVGLYFIRADILRRDLALYPCMFSSLPLLMSYKRRAVENQSVSTCAACEFC